MSESQHADAEPAQLQAAFRAGWKVAAKWANRPDLLADIGSPAYLKDMAAALAPMQVGALPVASTCRDCGAIEPQGHKPECPVAELERALGVRHDG